MEDSTILIIIVIVFFLMMNKSKTKENFATKAEKIKLVTKDPNIINCYFKKHPEFNIFSDEQIAKTLNGNEYSKKQKDEARWWKSKGNNTKERAIFHYKNYGVNENRAHT